MKTIKREALERVLKVSECASSDKTRYDLQNVRLQLLWPTTVKIEATDGHILTKVEIKEGAAGLEEFETTEIFFSPNNIKQLKGFLKSSAGSSECIISYYKDRKSFQFEALDEYFVILDRKDDVQFPDTTCFQSDMPNATLISFNPEKLMRIFKTRNWNKNYTATIAFEDANSPIRVFLSEPDGTESFSLLMPCKLEGRNLLDIEETLKINKKEKAA